MKLYYTTEDNLNIRPFHADKNFCKINLKNRKQIVRELIFRRTSNESYSYSILCGVEVRSIFFTHNGIITRVWDSNTGKYRDFTENTNIMCLYKATKKYNDILNEQQTEKS